MCSEHCLFQWMIKVLSGGGCRGHWQVQTSVAVYKCYMWGGGGGGGGGGLEEGGEGGTNECMKPQPLHLISCTKLGSLLH